MTDVLSKRDLISPCRFLFWDDYHERVLEEEKTLRSSGLAQGSVGLSQWKKKCRFSKGISNFHWPEIKQKVEWGFKVNGGTIIENRRLLLTGWLTTRGPFIAPQSGYSPSIMPLQNPERIQNVRMARNHYTWGRRHRDYHDPTDDPRL